jgi:hypothetical protein
MLFTNVKLQHTSFVLSVWELNIICFLFL